jgi:hypothetical protein
MSGEDDEHPASSSAVCFPLEMRLHNGEGRDDSHSKMMATAIRIISTWWYPRNGMNPGEPRGQQEETGMRRGMRRGRRTEPSQLETGHPEAEAGL